MDELCEELGGKRVTLNFLFGRRNLAPLRYLVLFFQTGLVLLKERPSIVYAQNPPIFCPLSCMPYCKIWRSKLIVDHHAVWSTKTLGNGFLGNFIRNLERFVSKHAFANTAPHPFWASELDQLGARRVGTIFDYVRRSVSPRDSKIHDEFSQGREFLILAPHGGHPLEKIESEVEACSSIEKAALLLSGPESKLRKRIEHIILPKNVRYIGFLEKERFERLKASADLGMCITDEPFTLSHSLLEFAACSVPVISSKQAPVEALFGDSLLYVESSKPSEVQKTIRQVLGDENLLATYRERVSKKSEEISLQRQNAIKNLKLLIASE